MRAIPSNMHASFAPVNDYVAKRTNAVTTGGNRVTSGGKPKGTRSQSEMAQV
jgi:hypothetical protein